MPSDQSPVANRITTLLNRRGIGIGCGTHSVCQQRVWEAGWHAPAPLHTLLQPWPCPALRGGRGQEGHVQKQGYRPKGGAATTKPTAFQPSGSVIPGSLIPVPALIETMPVSMHTPET